jgi:nitrite reductase/ring-hydroxylating ferredoxin subunit
LVAPDLLTGTCIEATNGNDADVTIPLWQFYSTVLVIVYSFYRLLFAPTFEPSLDYHNNKSAMYAKMRSKFFFPAFANGWHAVCNSEDVRGGKVKSISALGTHMVAFRGEDGKVGVLHAFCPHLGAHLGQGGVVEGNLLVCPFHKWSFNSSGKCKRIPYTKLDAPPERAQTKSYPVKESLGQVYIWFHAEEDRASKPEWELMMGDELEAGVKDGTWYYALMRRLEYNQHSCEMAMNSADPHHFDTLHAPFPLPFIEYFVAGVHKIKAWYEEGIDAKGKTFKQKQYSYITEDTTGLYFFNNKSFPVPFSEAAAQSIHTTVTFEGPTIVHFVIHTPFGTPLYILYSLCCILYSLCCILYSLCCILYSLCCTHCTHYLLYYAIPTVLTIYCTMLYPLYSLSTVLDVGKMWQVKTLLPIEPFKQYVESRWYAQRTVPSFIVSFFAYIGAMALEQDRQVWENKIFRLKPMLVSGDGPFPAFVRWYAQFYSEKSKELETNSLDW